jgi:uncharacterized protein YjdB
MLPFRLLVPALGLATACFGGTETTEPGDNPPPSHPPAITISMGPADGAVAVGRTLQFQATANIVAAGWEWSSRNAVIAAVGPSGLVLGMSPGTARIQACVVNAPTFCGVVDLTVVEAPAGAVPEVTLTPGDMTINVGQSLDYSATAVNFAEPAWTWFSVDPVTATITETGRLTGRRQGVAVIAACSPVAPKYCGTAIVQVR